MQASETAKINECIDRFADAIRQQEEDDAKAIAGLFALIAGLGLAIMIGITIIGAPRSTVASVKSARSSSSSRRPHEHT